MPTYGYVTPPIWRKKKPSDREYSDRGMFPQLPATAPNRTSSDRSLGYTAPPVQERTLPDPLAAAYRQMAESQLAATTGEISRQLAQYLQKASSAADILGKEFQTYYIQPAARSIEDVASTLSGALTETAEAYGIPFQRALGRLQEDLAERLRALQYEYGARDRIGSGAWVRSRENLLKNYQRALTDALYNYLRGVSRFEETDVETPLQRIAQGMRKGALRAERFLPSLTGWEDVLYSSLRKLSPIGEALASDYLRTLRDYGRYELANRLNLANALYSMYGTPAMVSTFGELFTLGGLPRQLAETNIQALINDLLYRIGLGTRIAGGFGQPYITSREIIQATTPMDILNRGLSALAYGYLSKQLRGEG